MGVIPTFNFLLSISSSSSAEYDSPMAWVKVLLFLTFLGIIAFSLNYFSKKRNLNLLVNKKSKLYIVDRCSLGNRQFIVVAQYESEKHLLSVGASGVSHLAKLSQKEPLSEKDSKSN